jgi:uncharacterized protein involved in exopolysaccharide biosynthesis/Mrp family chromosome partitioning ATPase
MDEDRLLSLRYWSDLVSRFRWLILACVAGVGLLAAIVSANQDPVFESTCRLYLNPQKVQPLTFVELYQEDRGRPNDFLLTQMEILKSTPILTRAVEDAEAEGILHFTDSSAPAAPSLKERALGWLGIEPDSSGRTAEEARRGYVSRLRRAVATKSASGNAFLAVTVSSNDPRLAAQLANAIASAYVKNDREMRRRNADDAIAWLSERVDEQRSKLLVAEKGLRAFKRIPPEDAEQGNDLTVREIGHLQQALLDVRLQLLQAQASQISSRGESGSDSSMTGAQIDLEAQVNSALRSRVQQELIDNAVQLNQLRQRYGERHPDVLKAAERDAQLKRELARLGPMPIAVGAGRQATVALDPSQQIEILRAQERTLRSSLDKTVAESAAKGQEGMRYAILRREVELNRTLYNEMLNRLNELTISVGLDTATAEIFESAQPPAMPVSPDHRQNVLLGVFAGLLLGLGSAVVRDHLDESVRNPGHANDLLRVPVLGLIPQFVRDRSPETAGRARLEVGIEPYSASAEGFRILRSHIEGALGDEEAGVLVLTSTVPGEGKTATAANLAVAFAEAGDRVLLVDGDVRRPSLGRYFRLSGDTCLSEVLRGDTAPESAAQASGVDRLDVVGCKPGALIPDGIHFTEGFQRLFAWARPRYRRVVVDAPVVMAVPGVAEIAHAGALVLLVHRPSWVSAPVLEQVREHLLLSRCRLGGVILNDVRGRWTSSRYPLLPYYSKSYRPRPTSNEGTGRA